MVDNYTIRTKLYKVRIKNKISCDENNQIDDAKAGEINMENFADVESAYEDCFDSDESDEESERNSAQQSSTCEIPLFRFTNSGTRTNNKTVIKSSVSSKVKKNIGSTLEDKMSDLNLDVTRSIRSAVMHPHRKNMTFTNDELMKIERDNEILLRKIMAQQKSKKSKVQVTSQKLSSSAINRKKSQKKIDEDNMMLLQRLQKAKSCVLNTNKIPGFRLTHT